MSDEDLKSYIKSYYLDRKMTYTKLDKHDKAIGVLLEENKQLKEEIENIKDFNNKLQASKDRLDKDDYNLAHILIELEEYIKKHIEEWENDEDEYLNGVVAEDKDILQLIQELKEKYK